MTDAYHICTRCVMDTSDPQISFDEAGVCNHCRTFESHTRQKWRPEGEETGLLEQQLEIVRRAGAGKEYDCILGLSGGIDSSYLALKVHEWGLRPLVVHVDTGWNSELATANIEVIVKHCDFDLHTVVMDWPEMRDLHLAYLRAGVPNQDVPQDHAIFANLYRYAVANRISYTISGSNLATESVLPASWGGPNMDAINLRAIHKAHGSRPLKHYKTISFWDYFVLYPWVHRMRVLAPLNYMRYDKDAAISELEKIGWRSYGRKHGESRFTKFFQNYYLPHKFGYDKRKAHYSSLILSGHMTRDAALKALQAPLYSPEELEADMIYFCKKLGLSQNEFISLLEAQSRDHSDYPNWGRLMRVGSRIKRLMAGLQPAQAVNA